MLCSEVPSSEFREEYSPFLLCSEVPSSEFTEEYSPFNALFRSSEVPSSKFRGEYSPFNAVFRSSEFREEYSPFNAVFRVKKDIGISSERISRREYINENGPGYDVLCLFIEPCNVYNYREKIEGKQQYRSLCVYRVSQ